jgi:acetyltransferase
MMDTQVTPSAAVLALVPPPGAAERIILRDGRLAYLRPVTPAAKPLIAAAMRTLSPTTSYRRFFTVRYQLSDDELERMTNLDGWRQYAIGAVGVHADGRTEGIGVARWARVEDDPETADFALLIVDAWQGHGLGKAMLSALTAIARERGIRRFRGMVLAENTPMFAMLERVAPGYRRKSGREYETVELDLAASAIRVAA